MAQTILLADTEPSRIAMMQDALQSEGYHVTAVGSGIEALITIFDCPPDLLVLNDELPDMKGHELLKAVRQRVSAAKMPVLLLHKPDRNAGGFRNWQGGADCYLAIPFLPRDLKVFARRIFQLKEAEERGENRFPLST